MRSSRYFNAQYWNARYFSAVGADAVVVADCPQIIQINITITPAAPGPTPAGTGLGRVFFVPWGRPQVLVIGGQIPHE